MPDLDYKAWSFFLSAVNSFGVLGTIIYVHLTSKQKANAASIEQTNQNHNTLTTRVVRVEKTLEHMPSHDDIKALDRRISELAQLVTRMDGVMGQMNRTIIRVDDYLLNNK